MFEIVVVMQWDLLEPHAGAQHERYARQEVIPDLWQRRPVCC